MFKKPISNVKSFSPMRSSDRRRFQNEIYEAYPALKEKCTQEGASPSLPETLLSAKFASHLNVKGVVYVADNKPLWLKLEGLKPIPTVYTLWQHADALPILYTWAPVIRKLIDGADLMIPGLVPGPDGTLPDVAEGEVVAITVKGYQYPLAVGTMVLPTRDIVPRSGMKGKAVHLLHVYRDYLWAMGDKSDPPDMKDMSEDEDEEEDEEQDDDNHRAQEPTESSTSPDAAEEPHTVAEERDRKKLSTSDVDEILKKSLLQALLYKLKPENAQTQLPMSASVLYSSYILPSRPADIGEEADIKRSSWKKMQKFLKTMEKADLLKIKEQRGEVVVTSVDWNHPDFLGLKPYKTIENGSSSSNESHQQASKADQTRQTTQASGPIQVQELYKPVGSTIAFFEAINRGKDELFAPAEARQAAIDYIKEKNLANPRNQKMVRLDAILCDALLSKSEVDTVNELARDQVVKKLLDKMQPFHTLTLPGQEPILRKGNAKPVVVTQEIRQNNKTVTKIVGVENFFIDPNEVCKALTKLCASSATSNALPGSSPKNPMSEIMVQGPQFKHVNQLLLEKGVPKQLIEFNDKTKKRKGK